MDKRISYIMVLDTETANTLVKMVADQFDENGVLVRPAHEEMDMSCVLAYDFGWAIVDRYGKVYETASFVNSDIFYRERELMKSAYYADKIPRYEADIYHGSRKVADTYTIRREMLDAIARWNVVAIAAYNARFDYNAMNILQRFITGSKYRYWLPYGTEVEIWDIMKMAQDTICSQAGYKEWCREHGYIIETTGRVRKTAEMVYRYITGDHDFNESHTGLEDVLIETAIMAHCFRQHKTMRKRLFENEKPKIELAPFDIKLRKSLKEVPTIRIGE